MHGSKAVDDNVGEIHTLADATITAAKPNMGNDFIPFHKQKSYFTSLLLLLENVSRLHASTICACTTRNDDVACGISSGFHEWTLCWRK
jgi:hypothetical protein